jgi:uncharacterized protein YlxW (UPF0749 family)
LALKAIEEDIVKYRTLDGQVDVSGPGIQIEISDDIESIWLVDLINELFANGAEALSINDVRLTNYTHGFDTLPQGQILLNGNIISKPITIKVIGPFDALKPILEQPKGILDKLYEHHSPLQITIAKKDPIEMSKVL